MRKVLALVAFASTVLVGQADAQTTGAYVFRQRLLPLRPATPVRSTAKGSGCGTFVAGMTYPGRSSPNFYRSDVRDEAAALKFCADSSKSLDAQGACVWWRDDERGYAVLLYLGYTSTIPSSNPADNATVCY